MGCLVEESIQAMAEDPVERRLAIAKAQVQSEDVGDVDLEPVPDLGVHFRILEQASELGRPVPRRIDPLDEPFALQESQGPTEKPGFDTGGRADLRERGRGLQDRSEEMEAGRRVEGGRYQGVPDLSPEIGLQFFHRTRLGGGRVLGHAPSMSAPY